jgi:hypothetical protein
VGTRRRRFENASPRDERVGAGRRYGDGYGKAGSEKPPPKKRRRETNVELLPPDEPPEPPDEGVEGADGAAGAAAGADVEGEEDEEPPLLLPLELYKSEYQPPPLRMKLPPEIWRFAVFS